MQITSDYVKNTQCQRPCCHSAVGRLYIEEEASPHLSLRARDAEHNDVHHLDSMSSILDYNPLLTVYVHMYTDVFLAVYMLHQASTPMSHVYTQ